MARWTSESFNQSLESESESESEKKTSVDKKSEATSADPDIAFGFAQ
jgi:hypothetical protein